MVLDSILEAIGKTPTVRLKALSNHLGVNVYAKLESLNPGKSHKVRIALGMILAAESKGILVRGKGQTVIEPSGGNTGIGLAIAGNILGYHILLVIPDNYSVEKQKLLTLYGAEVVLSDSRLGNNSHGEKAMQLQFENPHYVMLNQQRNPANPETHRMSTAKEILADFPTDTISYFVAGIGTGGHITGIGEILRQRWPDINIYGVEPEGCDLLNNIHHSHDIQGLSIGIIPENLNITLLDGMISVTTKECIEMVKEIMSTDSISLGISSAANLVAIKKLAKTIKKDSNVLTVIYDEVDSYLSYFQ